MLLRSSHRYCAFQLLTPPHPIPRPLPLSLSEAEHCKGGTNRFCVCARAMELVICSWDTTDLMWTSTCVTACAFMVLDSTFDDPMMTWWLYRFSENIVGLHTQRSYQSICHVTRSTTKQTRSWKPLPFCFVTFICGNYIMCKWTPPAWSQMSRIERNRRESDERKNAKQTLWRNGRIETDRKRKVVGRRNAWSGAHFLCSSLLDLTHKWPWPLHSMTGGHSINRCPLVRSRNTSLAMRYCRVKLDSMFSSKCFQASHTHTHAQKLIIRQLIYVSFFSQMPRLECGAVLHETVFEKFPRIFHLKSANE